MGATMTRSTTTSSRWCPSLHLSSLTWSLLTIFLLTLSVTIAETLNADMTDESMSISPSQDWEDVEGSKDWVGQEGSLGLGNIRVFNKRQAQPRVVRSDQVRYHRCYFNPV